VKEAIDILIRRKWLFIIPFAVVFIVPVVLSLFFMRSYEANSLVWLDSDVSIAPVLNEQATVQEGDRPIQTEADTLQQLLQSRAFLTGVIAKTPLQSKMDTERGRAQTIAFVRKNLRTEVVGPNALRITFYGRSPKEAVTVVGVTTDEFLSWVRQSVKQQNEKSTTFFSDKSKGYANELETARTELQRLKEKYPATQQLEILDKALAMSKITASPAVQSEFQRLKAQEEYAQGMYDSSLTDLAKIRVLASAQEERYLNGLRIVDKPVTPTSFSLKRLLLLDFLALMAAIIVGTTAVVIAELTDRTFRTERDVQDELHLPVLVEVGESARSARKA